MDILMARLYEPGTEDALQQIPGSIIARCDTCERPILVAPQGQRLIDRGATPRCEECCDPDTIEFDDEVVTIATLNEASRYLGRPITFDEVLEVTARHRLTTRLRRDLEKE